MASISINLGNFGRQAPVFKSFMLLSPWFLWLCGKNNDWNAQAGCLCYKMVIKVFGCVLIGLGCFWFLFVGWLLAKLRIR
ncbi:hypothetical protein NIES4071_93760 [Calothrix sp. NIES-4071]|nr:hypothetical protein NIES4071_93760 [Calothrix sp. NIES-4071]BAZ63641.1 hypothetical protein NIES4105_93690 [Calothrix sp. NIES-4105]